MKDFYRVLSLKMCVWNAVIVPTCRVPSKSCMTGKIWNYFFSNPRLSHAMMNVWSNNYMDLFSAWTFLFISSFALYKAVVIKGRNCVIIVSPTIYSDEFGISISNCQMYSISLINHLYSYRGFFKYFCVLTKLNRYCWYINKCNDGEKTNNWKLCLDDGAKLESPKLLESASGDHQCLYQITRQFGQRGTRHFMSADFDIRFLRMKSLHNSANYFDKTETGLWGYSWLFRLEFGLRIFFEWYWMRIWI